MVPHRPLPASLALPCADPSSPRSPVVVVRVAGFPLRRTACVAYTSMLLPGRGQGGAATFRVVTWSQSFGGWEASLSDSATNPIGTHISELPGAIEDVWPIVDDKGIIVELVRTWEDDAFVCLDEAGRPVDDIGRTHHLVPSALFKSSDVPDEWNIVAVRRVSSGMTQLEALTADKVDFDERRQLEVLTQLNAGAGIVIDEIDTTPPYTHIVQLGGEFYLAQMRSTAGMAQLSGDGSVLGDLAEAKEPVCTAAGPATTPGAEAESPSPIAVSVPPGGAAVPAETPAAGAAARAPESAAAIVTAASNPVAEGVTTALKPSAESAATAPEPRPDAAPSAESGSRPEAPRVETLPPDVPTSESSVADEIARRVKEAAAGEAAAGDRPRRRRAKTAKKPSLAAVAKTDGDPDPQSAGSATLAAVAKPDSMSGGAGSRGATLDALAKPDAPTGDRASTGGLAAVARPDDEPTGDGVADLLKAVASPLDASADSAELEATPRPSTSAKLRSALDPDEQRPGGTPGATGDRAAALVDELRPDGEDDPLRAASLAQADEFVSSAADGTLEISDESLTLEQVRAADRFAWDELMNLYLPHIGFVATRVARTAVRGGKSDVTYLPRSEAAMRPIGWHHLAGCDCESCR
jgi:hypothetical protein